MSAMECARERTKASISIHLPNSQDRIYGVGWENVLTKEGT